MTDDKLTRCVVLLEGLTADMAEVRTDIKAQNGRVTALEKDVLRVKTLGSAAVFVFGFFADWLRHRLGLS